MFCFVYMGAFTAVSPEKHNNSNYNAEILVELWWLYWNCRKMAVILCSLCAYTTGPLAQ